MAPATRSDRGVQYACHKFRDILSANKLVGQSMSDRRPVGKLIAGTMRGIPFSGGELFQNTENRTYTSNGCEVHGDYQKGDIRVY
jgi:hypothetical protein